MDMADIRFAFWFVCCCICVLFLWKDRIEHVYKLKGHERLILQSLKMLAPESKVDGEFHL